MVRRLHISISLFFAVPNQWLSKLVRDDLAWHLRQIRPALHIHWPEVVNKIVRYSRSKQAYRNQISIYRWKPPKINKQTYWTLSWGLALRFPLTEEEGSRRLCSQIEFAPFPYNVCTIYTIKKQQFCKLKIHFTNWLFQTWWLVLRMLRPPPHLQLRGWPSRMSQMSDLRAVSPQTSVDAAAFVADQHTPVHRRPAWLYNTFEIVIQLSTTTNL